MAASAERVMDLILWRHAEAEDGLVDAERRLTPRGRKQAKRMAAWLNARLPRRCVVLASPALRAQQTAEALGRPVETTRALDVDASPREVLKACGWPRRGGTVVVVGHQPTLGQVAASLLAGAAENWSVKKGAAWWLTARSRGGRTETVLAAVLPPELV